MNIQKPFKKLSVLKEKKGIDRKVVVQKETSKKIEELEQSLQQNRLDSGGCNRRAWKQEKQYDSSLNCSFSSNYQQIIDDYKQQSTKQTPQPQQGKTILKQTKQSTHTNKIVQFENQYNQEKARKEKKQQIVKPLAQSNIVKNIGESIQQNMESTLKANIEKAKVNPQGQQHHQLEAYLEAIGLERYFYDLVKHKVNDLSTLIKTNKKQLQTIGLAPGHVIKLTKKIEQDKMKEGEEEGKEEEVIEEETPSNRLSLLKNKRQHKASKDNIEKQIQQQQNQPGSLLQGTFDEQQSHNYFLEALMELRNSNKTPQQPQIQEKKSILKTNKQNLPNEEKPKNNVAFEKQSMSQSQKSFFFNDSESDIKLMDVFFMPDFQKADDLNESSLLQNVEQCKNCYKKFKSEKPQKYCSFECEDNFVKFNTVKCYNKFCQKPIQKDQCLNIMKMNFCNNHCFQFFDSNEDKKQYFKDKQYLQEVQQTFIENKQKIKEMEQKIQPSVDEQQEDDEFFASEIDLIYNPQMASLNELEVKYKGKK